MNKSFLCLILGLFLIHCDNESSVHIDYSDIAQVNLIPGFQRLSVTIDYGHELYYGLWVPNLQEGERVPLVIALHGAPGRYPPPDNCGYNLLQTLVQPALADMRAVMVAPNVPDESWIDETGEQTIIQLISVLKTAWPVDPERIYITGYSMGGIGTWFLADKYPDAFHGAIPIASQPVGFLSGTVPHYVIQGEYDEEFGTDMVRRAVEVIHSKHRKVKLVIADSLNHGCADKYIPYLRDCIGWFRDSIRTE